MKNIYDVMRQKELELERLTHEIEALRIVVPILSDEIARDILPSYSASQQWTKPLITADTGRHTGRVWP
jgi:hypothetical protein